MDNQTPQNNQRRNLHKEKSGRQYMIIKQKKFNPYEPDIKKPLSLGIVGKQLSADALPRVQAPKDKPFSTVARSSTLPQKAFHNIKTMIPQFLKNAMLNPISRSNENTKREGTNMHAAPRQGIGRKPLLTLGNFKISLSKKSPSPTSLDSPLQPMYSKSNTNHQTSHLNHRQLFKSSTTENQVNKPLLPKSLSSKHAKIQTPNSSNQCLKPTLYNFGIKNINLPKNQHDTINTSYNSNDVTQCSYLNPNVNKRQMDCIQQQKSSLTNKILARYNPEHERTKFNISRPQRNGKSPSFNVTGVGFHNH